MNTVIEGESGAKAGPEARPAGLIGRTIQGVTPNAVHDWRSRRMFSQATRCLPRDTVYHEPNYILKRFVGPSVVTFHDLSVYHYPQFHPMSRVKKMERNLPLAADAALHIITDSDLVREEVIGRFPVDPAKVSAIHLGVSEEFRPVEDTERRAILRQYGLTDGGYLFCVATYEPRKNLSGLIAAFSRLPRRLRKQVPLVLAGSSGWLNANLSRTLGEHVERREVIQLGYVPRNHLPALYSGTLVFLFPSFYEGFGLPVLEAMACGAPVVTSRGTAMEEVAAGAVELIDPADNEALTEVMECLVEDTGRRDRLAAAGCQRAAEFTWRKCADRHIEVLRAASSRAGAGN